jgi:8-oxo-dGTP pyrophosphatase MutT (NUDIX family)
VSHLQDAPLAPNMKKGAPVEKVTVFVMGRRAGAVELLLLYHPHAGIHLPAGTVEAGESAMAAALREAQEETGLQGLVWGGLLGVEREELAPAHGVMALSTPVYIRPEAATFSYASATLRNGMLVEVLRADGDFLQVRYAESDRFPDPQYKTFELVGWVPAHTVSGVRVRHFARLTVPNSSSDFSLDSVFDSASSSWTNLDDHHNFTLRWHRLDTLPELVPPQAPWLRYLPAE